MAGAGRRVFTPGEVLTASNTMSYLMDQAVMVFDDAAARGSALGTAVVSEGMVTYLKDTGTLEKYDGSSWGAAAGLREIVLFTSSGTFSKGDYPWLRAIRVKAVGAGGGGGGVAATGAGQGACSGAGGAGGYSESFITDIAGLSSSVTVTIGAGGAGGAAGSVNGSAGGDTSFGTLVVAHGGAFGNGSGAAASPPFLGGASGLGGVAGTGLIVVAGEASLRAPILNVGLSANSPSASSYFGGGSFVGVNATPGSVGYGVGGMYAQNGVNAAARAGGTGGNGLVIVELYS